MMIDRTFINPVFIFKINSLLSKENYYNLPKGMYQ